jgi:hypothetical protein
MCLLRLNLVEATFVHLEQAGIVKDTETRIRPLYIENCPLNGWRGADVGHFELHFIFIVDLTHNALFHRIDHVAGSEFVQSNERDWNFRTNESDANFVLRLATLERAIYYLVETHVQNLHGVVAAGRVERNFVVHPFGAELGHFLLANEVDMKWQHFLLQAAGTDETSRLVRGDKPQHLCLVLQRFYGVQVQVPFVHFLREARDEIELAASEGIQLFEGDLREIHDLIEKSRERGIDFASRSAPYIRMRRFEHRCV